MSDSGISACLLWDSSALGKRYNYERGSATVDALFGYALPMVTVDMAYAETANIIRRQKNADAINEERFEEARRDLKSEVLTGGSFTLMHLTGDAIVSSIDLADKHNLNSIDAAFLYLFLEYVKAQTLPCVLIVADARFVRAATAEGLTCLNPEVIAPGDLPGFFQGL